MKRMPRGSGLVLGVLWLLMGDLATAGDATQQPFGVFTMLDGQGVEVCEACLKALESLPSNLTGCERNYDPAFGFEGGPFWKEVDPLKNLALLKQVMMFLIPIDSERGVGRGLSRLEGTIYEDDVIFKREIKILMKQERIRFALAKMDIDNDGHPEPVLKFRYGSCGDPHPGPGSATFQTLMVLRPDRKEIDLIKTEVIMQNAGKTSDHPAGNVFSQLYDVFNHQKRFYFDRWDNDGIEPDTFSVYLAKRHSVKGLCKFRYERRYQSPVQEGKP